MTSWSPDIAQADGPRYLAIAERIAGDIAAGRLKPGDRLPPQRDLAWKLGVTLGTVTRGYNEAERRGLIGGEVGRGTFVRERTVDTPPPPAAGEFVDLGRNLPDSEFARQAIADLGGELSRSAALGSLLNYAPNAGLAAHRAAGALWVGSYSVAAGPGDIVVTAGGQHAMTIAFGILARPGDVVLTEQLTFYGMKSLAKFLNLRLHGVSVDEHGLVPAALDLACRQMQPKALYCLPTLHNPTTATMPLERRQEVAVICRRHGVTIVEDDIYAFLAPDAPPPIASLAPDISIYIASLSKCIAPGLRVGFVRAPAPLVEPLAAALRATTWMATPFAAEISARLILSGEALRIAQRQRAEAASRQALARRLLAGLDLASPESSMHLWLRLPEPWRREEFTALARQRGVGVAPAEAFAVGRGPVPHAVRLGLLSTGRAPLEKSLAIVADILRGQPDTGSPMV